VTAGNGGGFRDTPARDTLVSGRIGRVPP